MRFYFARVMAHFTALMMVPLLWWYAPKSLLFVIKLNTQMMAWVVHAAVGFIPDPTARHYATRLLQVGDAIGRMLKAGLMLVPVQYRDQVEVLARVRYEPGGWMMVGELGLIFFVVWLWLRRRPKEKLLIEAPRVEPTLPSPPVLRLPRGVDWPERK